MIKIKITTSTSFNEPSLSRIHPMQENKQGKGDQKFWRYKNGYGASAVRFWIRSMILSQNDPGSRGGMMPGSYGSANRLWELAVLKFNKAGSFELCYTTPITSDVLGYLKEKEVETLLKKIKELKEVKKVKKEVKEIKKKATKNEKK